MPFNGAGTFTLPAGNPVSGVSNSMVHNNTNSEIAVALTNCVTRDGQSPATANIPMAGFKFTGMGAGGTTGDSVTYEQLQAVLALTVPMPPQGSILPWVPGYFTDGSNGGYTNALGTANTVASANTYLNASGWYVCDGAAVNDAASAIFNGAGRYLPNLTDSRFLMGSTAAGTIGGSNTLVDHLHGFTLTAAGQTHTGNSASVSNPGDHYHAQNAARYDAIGVCNTIGAGNTAQGTISTNTGLDGGHGHTVSISHTHADSAVSGSIGTGAVPSSTENRPKFLSCFYIMRVK